MDILHQGGVAVIAFDVQCGAHGTVLRPCEVLQVGDIPELFGIENIDIPVVIIDGLILIYAEEVACLTGLEHFAAVLFVKDAGHLTVFIKGDRIERGVDLMSIGRNFKRRSRNLCRYDRKRFAALGRQVVQERHGTIGCFLYGIDIAGFVLQSLCLAITQFNHIAADKAGSVVHGNAFPGGGQCIQALLAQCRDFGFHLGILFFGDFVYFVDGGTGQNIMELIDEDSMPQLVDFCLWVCDLGLCQQAEQFQVHHVQLNLTVGTLVARHGGVCAAVILKVEFTFPCGQAAVVLHTLSQLIKVGACKCLTHFGQSLDALFHTGGGFQHGAGRTAAAVTVTVGNQDIIVDVLLLVAVPAADQRIGMQDAVVSREEVILALTDPQRCDKVGQDFGAVNAAPLEGVVRHFVELVPCQLCGHEIINAALCHDLRQRARIAEHVRQPENAVVHTELFLEETLAVQELTHQAFAAGQVAVRLNPHTAFGFPASLRHALFDLLIQLGVALLQEVIQLRLAGHKLVVGVFVHQFQHSCKTAAHFFPGLCNSPPPCHVNVRVANAACNDFLMTGKVGIKCFCQIPAGSSNALIETLVIRCAQVDQIDSLVQHVFQIAAGFAVLFQPGKSLQRHNHIVVKTLNFGVDFPQVYNQVEFGMQDSGVGLQFQTVLLTALGAAVQQDVAVVHIHALCHLAVHKQQELRVFGIVPLINLGADVHPQRFSVHFLRHSHIRAEPVMLVRSVPMHGAAVKGFKRCRVCIGIFRAQEVARLYEPVARFKLLFYRKLFQLIADTCDALVKKINGAHRSFLSLITRLPAIQSWLFFAFLFALVERIYTEIVVSAKCYPVASLCPFNIRKSSS